MSEKKKIQFKGISYNSPTVLSFAIVSLVVLILGKITNDASTSLLFCVYRSPISFPFFIRLIGHTLGHSGWAHYLGNMSLFLLLGPALEEKYGSVDLLIMMAITAVISGLLNILIFPHTALLGASGLVFMMIVLTSASCMKEGKIPLTMILVVIIYIGQEIYTGLTQSDNISQLTHIVGGICGAVFGFVLSRPVKKSKGSTDINV